MTRDDDRANRFITRRQFLLRAGIVSTGGVLAASSLNACTSPASTTPQSPQPTTAPAKVASTNRTIQFSIEAGTSKTKNVQENLADFKQKTGIEPKLVEVPLENSREKIMTDMLSGSPQFDTSMTLAEAYLPQFAAAQLLEPIQQHMTAEQLNDLSPLAKQLSTYDGQLYGWPWFEHTVGILYYRTDLLKEAGIVGADGNPKPPETWTEYVDAAKKLTKGDVYGTIVEAKRDQEPFWRFLGLLWQAGGDIFDDKGKVIIDSPEAVEAVQFQVDLIHKHKVSPPGSFNYYNVDTHTLFLQGKLAMAENWPYMFPMANDPAQSKVVGNFAVAPTIGYRKRTWSTNGFTWIVPKNAKNKAEAIEFLKWVTSRPILIDLAKRYQLPMSRQSLRDAPEITQYKHASAVLQAVNMGRTIPLTPKWAEIRDAIIDEWQAALLQQKQPLEAMRAAGERVRKVVGA